MDKFSFDNILLTLASDYQDTDTLLEFGVDMLATRNEYAYNIGLIHLLLAADHGNHIAHDCLSHSLTAEIIGDAFNHLKSLADKGDATALYYLALCYERGYGFPSNMECAFRCYEKAAYLGKRAAQFRVGVFYELGLSVNQDFREAARWYRMSSLETGQNKDYLAQNKDYFCSMVDKEENPYYSLSWEISKIQSSAQIHSPRRNKRILPCFVLIDNSEHLGDDEMQQINELIQNLVSELNLPIEESHGIEIGSAIISYADNIKWISTANKFSHAGSISFRPLVQGGLSNLGKALSVLSALLDDEILGKQIIKSRHLRPYFIFVTKGQTNDDWQNALKQLKKNPHFNRSYRFALAIGNTANKGVLEALTENSETILSTTSPMSINDCMKRIINSMKSDIRLYEGEDWIEEDSDKDLTFIQVNNNDVDLCADSIECEDDDDWNSGW